MATRGLGNMWTVFRPDACDGGSVMASKGGDVMGRVARINENNDIFKFSSRQGMHSGFGGM